MRNMCKVKYCTNPSRCKGYCSRHYARLIRCGDLNVEFHNTSTPKTCTFDKCNNPYFSKGLCKMHYERNRRWGTPEDRPRRKINGGKCIVNKCENVSVCKQMCWSHYERFITYGNPLAGGIFREKQRGNCKVKGCTKHSDSRGFCQAHYTTFTTYPSINPDGPFICYLCGKEHQSWDNHNVSVDHVIPKSRGGKNTSDNVRITCFTCNSKKSDATYEELLEWCKLILDRSLQELHKT